MRYKRGVHYERFSLLQLGWFSTARGSGSRALLRAVWEAIDSGQLDARIVFVFCNREVGESPETDEFLAQVQGYGIPLVTHSFERFRQTRVGKGMGLNGTTFDPWRVAYDQEALQRLSGYTPDLSVQAGYMLVKTPELCRRFPSINLHPALPEGPVGTWQQVLWQLIDERAWESGIFMHLATPDLDRGPVVTYCRYSLRTPALEPLWRELGDKTSAALKAAQGEASPLFQAARWEGMRREQPFILETLKAYVGRGLRVRDDHVVDAKGAPIAMLDLTAQVEAALEKPVGTAG